jgi:hypothetical protein
MDDAAKQSEPIWTIVDGELRLIGGGESRGWVYQHEGRHYAVDHDGALGGPWPSGREARQWVLRQWSEAQRP